MLDLSLDGKFAVQVDFTFEEQIEIFDEVFDFSLLLVENLVEVKYFILDDFVFILLRVD